MSQVRRFSLTDGYGWRIHQSPSLHTYGVYVLFADEDWTRCKVGSTDNVNVRLEKYASNTLHRTLYMFLYLTPTTDVKYWEQKVINVIEGCSLWGDTFSMLWEEMIGNRSGDGGIVAQVLKSVTDGIGEVPQRTMYGEPRNTFRVYSQGQIDGRFHPQALYTITTVEGVYMRAGYTKCIEGIISNTKQCNLHQSMVIFTMCVDAEVDLRRVTTQFYKSIGNETVTRRLIFANGHPEVYSRGLITFVKTLIRQKYQHEDITTGSHGSEQEDE